MDQAGMVAAHGKDLGDDVFLANGGRTGGRPARVAAVAMR
jgi:hypothetical protein